MRYFKVGGLRFLRIGRVQFSWCVVKRKHMPRRRAQQLIARVADQRALAQQIAAEDRDILRALADGH